MNILELKISINQVALMVIGVIIAVAFAVGAFSTKQWWWLVAVPMNVIGILLVVFGGARRRATNASRGMAISVVGGLFIAGSIWVAFMLGNAFPT